MLRGRPDLLYVLALCGLTVRYAAPASADALPVCDTQIRVGGSVYHDREPARSWALMYPAPSARGGVYRPGMHIAAYRIVTIEPRGIVLAREDQQCLLRMKAAVAAQPPPRRGGAAVPKKERKRARAAFTRDELSRGVRSVSPTRFVIDRALLQEALARAPKIARATKVRYVGSRAKPKGLLLRSFPKDGLLRSLGLKPNDVVKTINGFSLVTPDGMLGARALVNKTENLSLIIEREGRPMSLEYRVN